MFLNIACTIVILFCSTIVFLSRRSLGYDEVYKDARFILYERFKPQPSGDWIYETVLIPNCEGHHDKEVSVHDWPTGKGRFVR